MAIFHFSAKVISRGKGQSAIAAAAYRSGQRLIDEQSGEVKEYNARSQRIVFEGVFAPADAPAWAHDRQQLWNQAEQAEKRKDSQLAREIEVALPHEMTDQQREWLVKDFVREQFTREGYACDVAIHAPDRDSDTRNYHAHIMVTMRTIDEDGFAPTKDRSLNTREQLNEWREDWAHLTNRHLERHGIAAEIDHRSLAAQGSEREPQIHIGYAGYNMEARGVTPQSEVLTVNGREIDYPAIDGGQSRFWANADILRGNIEREQEELHRPRPSISIDPALEWTDRAGMAAQQDSALAWAAEAQQRTHERGHERGEARSESAAPRHEKSEREIFMEGLREQMGEERGHERARSQVNAAGQERREGSTEQREAKSEVKDAAREKSDRELWLEGMNEAVGRSSSEHERDGGRERER